MQSEQICHTRTVSEESTDIQSVVNQQVQYQIYLKLPNTPYLEYARTLYIYCSVSQLTPY